MSTTAKIIVDGTQLRLGDWPTEKGAAPAYDSAARFYRGEGAGRNGTNAPPRSKEELQRRASEIRALERGDTSVDRGVTDSPDSPGWTAQIGIDGWSYFLGRFPEEEQTAGAADMAIRQYWSSDPTNFEGDEAKPSPRFAGGPGGSNPRRARKADRLRLSTVTCGGSETGEVGGRHHSRLRRDPPRSLRGGDRGRESVRSGRFEAPRDGQHPFSSQGLQRATGRGAAVRR